MTAERPAPPARPTPPVLVVTNDFPPRRGGIESFVRSVCDGLANVVVLTATMPGSERVDDTVPYPVVRHRSRVLLPTRAVARHAEALLRDYGCDTVLYGASVPLGLLAPRLRRAGATRQVALTHGHEVWWARVPATRTALRRVVANVDVLTYVSDFCRAEIESALGSGGLPWARLAPGVDPRVFAPTVDGAEWRQRWRIDHDAPVVLAASRLVRRKGQDVLLAAWPTVVAAHPQARLVIMGDGPRRRALDRHIRRAGLVESVRLEPGTGWEQMPSVYAAADVFALPCRTRRLGLEPEALGIVFLEAAAAGLPVVVGRSGGAPETVVEGETGYVVDPCDPTVVAERLVGLLRDPDGAAAVGRRGRVFASRTYGLDQMVATARSLVWPAPTAPGPR